MRREIRRSAARPPGLAASVQSTPSSSTTSSTSTSTTTTSTTAPATPAPIGALITRTQPQGIYSISLPASWVFTNTSVPSDHLTNTWTDPADANLGLTVIKSGCQGCVVATSGSNTPDPQLDLPPGATVSRSNPPRQIYYTNDSPHAGYTDFGTVVVTDNATGISGFIKLDLVLPASQSAVANAFWTAFQSTRESRSAFSRVRPVRLRFSWLSRTSHAIGAYRVACSFDHDRFSH